VDSHFLHAGWAAGDFYGAGSFRTLFLEEMRRKAWSVGVIPGKNMIIPVHKPGFRQPASRSFGAMQWNAGIMG
jgi:hypothetical protein